MLKSRYIYLKNQNDLSLAFRKKKKSLKEEKNIFAVNKQLIQSFIAKSLVSLAFRLLFTVFTAVCIKALSIYIDTQYFALASNKSAPSLKCTSDSINLLMPWWFTFPWQKAIYGMQKSRIFNLPFFSFPLDSEHITGDWIKIKAQENYLKENHWSRHISCQIVF